MWAVVEKCKGLWRYRCLGCLRRVVSSGSESCCIVGVNSNSRLKLLDPVVRVSVGPGAVQGDGGMDQ